MPEVRSSDLRRLVIACDTEEVIAEVEDCSSYVQMPSAKESWKTMKLSRSMGLVHQTKDQPEDEEACLQLEQKSHDRRVYADG